MFRMFPVLYSFEENYPKRSRHYTDTCVQNKTNTESSNFEKLAVAKGTTNHMEVVWLELVLVLRLRRLEWKQNKFQQPYQNSVVVITNSHLLKLHPHWLRICRKFLITKVFISNPYNELLWATLFGVSYLANYIQSEVSKLDFHRHLRLTVSQGPQPCKKPVHTLIEGGNKAVQVPVWLWMFIGATYSTQYSFICSGK